MAENQSLFKRPRMERVSAVDTFLNNLDSDEALLLVRLVAGLDLKRTDGNGGIDTAYDIDEINLVMKFKDAVEREDLGVE